MVTNSQSRKWNIELNSVDKFGLTDEVILEKVKQLASVQYFCLSNLEKTKANNILHKHLYLYSPSPIYFNRLKTLFPTAHIEKAYGSSLENRAYCEKSGKWADEKNKDKLENHIHWTFLNSLRTYYLTLTTEACKRILVEGAKKNMYNITTEEASALSYMLGNGICSAILYQTKEEFSSQYNTYIKYMTGILENIKKDHQ